MANYKAIVIDVKSKSEPNGVEDRWVDVTTHMPIMTRDIKTPALDANSDLTAVVSGMPTIFARANLFKLAIEYLKNPENKERDEGLLNFYNNLVDEWKGFIAAIALDYTRIEVQRISLSYSDGRPLDDTANVYEPKGAFGNALFERRPLWSIQGVAANANNAPFIDVVYYEANRSGEKKVIGAVSPESLLFTAPGYKIETEHPYVNKFTRKLTDPLRSALSADEALTLLAYVEHIETRLNDLYNYYSKLPEGIRPDYATVQTLLRDWKEDIRQYCKAKGYNIEQKSIPPVNKFQEPNNLVFNYSSNLYGADGVIYDSDSDLPENAILFDPKNILLPKKSEIARIIFNNPEITRDPSLLSNEPIYVLKAEIKGRTGEYAYFALPLTPLGLNVFGKNIGALTGIDDNNAIRSKLKAVYNESMPIDNLEVSLEITTVSGKVLTTRESYTVNRAGCVSNKDIMLWPNFVARNWNRYFLYSEMPHNATSTNCPFKATPIVGTTDNGDFRIIIDEDNGEPMLLASGGEINHNPKIERDYGLKARLLIVADARISDNDYKYEIYESNLPFKGVKLSSNGRDSGYLVIRYESGQKANVPQNLIGMEQRSLKEVALGIDFGSTNTSVARAAENNPAQGITLQNHRVSLLQSGSNAPCQERELFFFQSKPTEGNSIKSILTLNAQRRMVKNDSQASAREVSGGMPCFDPSLLPVETVTDSRIRLKCFSIGDVDLVHNMKWNDTENDKNNKKAFLRGLLLHVYAQLYTEGEVPTFVKWSYPTAMSSDLISGYNDIWHNLTTDGLCPVLQGVKEGNGEPANQVEPYALKISDADVYTIDTSGEGWPSATSATADNGWGSAAQSASDGGWGASNASDGGWGSSSSDNGWGSPSNDAGGWGQQSTTMGGGWDDPKEKAVVEDLEPDSDEVDFQFQNVDQSKCMTEAAAVANFTSGLRNLGMTDRHLTLVFDVGGSTTDISALMESRGQTLMIKQNSIRFAAQQVTRAAGTDPNLKGALLEVCNRYKLAIPGFNRGRDKYDEKTASFYFEQVLDRLDADQLQELYNLICARCKQLMAINLYVTGLIVYYSGQITRKLIHVVRKSMIDRDPRYATWQPIVNVTFAGKGSRIFEWFSTVHPNAAKQYYQDLFFAGIGGMQEARGLLWGPPNIMLSEKVSPEVKYEVSKGLAKGALDKTVDQQSSLQVPKQSMESIEILGEDNFIIHKNSDHSEIPLNFDNSVSPKMFKRIGYDFKQSVNPGATFACSRFANFAFIFYRATQALGLRLQESDFMQSFKNMNIESYIRNLPEYRRASSQKKFDFVAPVIILEGMKFYEDMLMKKL